jgi:hypothetical protein
VIVRVASLSFFTPWIGSVLIDASVTVAPASINACRGSNSSESSKPSVASIRMRALERSAMS